MYKLEEVKEYLKNVLDAERIEKCYKLITNPELRVNSDDKRWVAWSQETELITVFNAICEILHINTNERNKFYDSYIGIIQDVCIQFTKWGINNKPRIPFYVLVLDKLIK